MEREEMYKEWEDEPNEEHFTHEGLACHILRQSTGHLCGYVELPPESTWHKLQSVQWDCPADVHGGITFGVSQLRRVPDGKQYIGFDCAHLGDLIPEYFGRWPTFEPEGVWYRNFDYVRTETKRLAEQVRASIPVATTKENN